MIQNLNQPHFSSTSSFMNNNHYIIWLYVNKDPPKTKQPKIS